MVPSSRKVPKFLQLCICDNISKISILLQGTLTVSQSTSDTSLILEMQLSITSADNFIDMTVTTDSANENLEPCLIHNSCNFCEIGRCNSHVQNYLKNGTGLQSINKYSAHLEYECGLAKEFVSSGNSTSQSISMTCDWGAPDPQWTPVSTVPDCECESCGSQNRTFAIEILITTFSPCCRGCLH